MHKEEKIVEHRNSGLMFGNLACIRKLIFHIFKNKTVIHNILFHIYYISSSFTIFNGIFEHLKMIHDLSENVH